MSLKTGGGRAMLLYQLAHRLRVRAVPLLPGLISQINFTLHGIDIDPAAVLDPTAILFHPSGVVIGAESVVEEGVGIWSGVVLGGRGSRNNPDGNPTIRKNVALGSGCKILGRVTIGEGAVVGANAVVLQDVDAWTTVVGVPAQIVAHRDERAETGMRM